MTGRQLRASIWGCTLALRSAGAHPGLCPVNTQPKLIKGHHDQPAGPAADVGGRRLECAELLGAKDEPPVLAAGNNIFLQQIL